MEKYFQLRERASENASIGTVKSINGKFDVEKIKEALQSHFDDEVSDIKVKEVYCYGSHYEASFYLKDREETETIDLEQTWLFF